jgi:hypothetical protein
MLGIGTAFDLPASNPADESNAIRYTREHLRIRDRNGAITKLIPNPAQRQFELTRGRKNIIVKARQMGITTWIAGRFFMKTITHPGVLTVQVAHTREAAHSIFRIVQRFWDCLPVELRKGGLRRSRANVGQMVFPALDSEFRVLTASDANCGRGLTIQNMHLSEVSRWPRDAAETLAGLRAALSPNGELVLESTPNGACGCFYEEWQQAEENHVVKHFFPWWLEPAYVSAAVTDLRDDELALKNLHHLTSEQIGYRRALEASYRGLHAQEFAEDPETCFLTSGDCCFDMDALETRLAEVSDATERRHDGHELQWFPPAAGKDYLVAADPAGGGSDGDYAALQVIELDSGLQCAELQQRLRPLELAHRAADLAHEYSTPGHPALIVVERNNHGHAVIAHLGHAAYYAHVYDHNGVAGWLTSASSKPEMVGHMSSLLAEHPEIFRSKRLLEECRSFINLPGGRAGAAPGAHDDMVMAMAMALAVRRDLSLHPRPRAFTRPVTASR